MMIRIALSTLLLVILAQSAAAQEPAHNRSIRNAGLRSDGDLVQASVSVGIRIVDDGEERLPLAYDVIVRVDGTVVQTHLVDVTRPAGGTSCTTDCPGPCSDLFPDTIGSCFDCGCDYIIVATSSHAMEPGATVDMTVVAARDGLPEIETDDDRATMIWDPTGQLDIWGVKTHDPLSGPPSTLFRFASDGSAFATIGVITLDGHQVDVDGLAVDADGRLFGYVAGNASGQLIAIDIATAVATAVGSPLSGREIRGAAFDRDGMIVGIDIFAGGLAWVDPSTGLPTAPDVPLTLDGNAFAPAFGTDLVIATDGRAILVSGPLFEVDLATGVLTELHDDQVPGPDGILVHGAGLALPADPGDGRVVLYDVNAEDDVFIYELAAPHDRALLFGDIVPGYNAGRGDLASYPREIEVGVAPVPAGQQLLAASPNPFNPRTEITFRLATAGPAELAVFDVRGRLVRVLRDGVISAGEHRATWNGRDHLGRAAPSGTYVYRLVTSSGVESRKMTLVQ